MSMLFIGVIGAGIILLAFFMNQTQRWDSDSVFYDLANIIGALLLVLYSYFLRAWPFVVLNSIWLLVSFVEMHFDVQKMNKRKGHIGHKRR